MCKNTLIIGRAGLAVGVLVAAGACGESQFSDASGAPELGPDDIQVDGGSSEIPSGDPSLPAGPDAPGGPTCPGANPDVSASDGWQSSVASTSAFDSLYFEFEARPGTANLNGLVAIGAEPIDDFSKAAIAVRFGDNGLVDVRDGAFYSSDLAYPYDPEVWYSIAISADIDAETYDVEIGPCGEPRKALINDATFRDGASVSGQLSAWAVWSSQTAPLEVSTPAWLTSDGCAPATCLSLGHACGEPKDGCGGTLSCGVCNDGEMCSSGTCIDAPANGPPPPPPACTPTTCQALGTECGQWSDGCGGILSCGDCSGGETCSTGVCVLPPPPACTPASCQSLGAECGLRSDGCGGTLSCGSCSGGGMCSNSVCVPPAPPPCAPATCQSLSHECGQPSNGCGGSLNCGACGSGEACDSGRCVSTSPPPPQPPLTFTHIVVDGSGPTNIWGKSVGDLNADGLPDIIAGGNGGGGLVWYANPSWTKSTIAPSGSFSTDHEVCDVDLDGDNDVVSITNGQLLWYANPGWGATTIANQRLHDIEVFDFDADGDCDVAGRSQGEFGASGATLFLYTQTTPSSWSSATRTIPNGEGLVAADLNGDGRLDVVTNEVWQENLGSGNWTQHTYSTAWAHDNAFIAVDDIDYDGNPDIVVSPSELEGETYRLSWLEAPDNPKQAGWVEHVVASGLEAVHHFVGTGDFDLDGDIDIATAEMQQGADPDNVKIYRNDGDALWTENVIDTDGNHSMRVVDIDLDGDLDLVGANWRDNDVDLFRNDTTRTARSLDSWTRHVIDGNSTGNRIFIESADLNGDNLPDIAAGAFWYANPGSPGETWTRTAWGSPLNNYATLDDFDQDGDIDVLGTRNVAAESNPDLVYGENNGSGSFTLAVDVNSGSGDFLQGVTVERFTPGEAKRVALSWHARSSNIDAATVPSDPLLDTWTLASLGVASEDEALSSADIDRDNDFDIFLGSTWAENTGAGFTVHTAYAPVGSGPDRNVLADINKDGRIDAVVGNEAISVPGRLAWYEQPVIAKNEWTTHVISDALVGPMSLDVADMDGDGDWDVIVGEHNLSTPANARLLIFENTDGVGGSWTPHTVYTGDEHHDGAQVVDIDRDGDFDIISVGWGHNDVLLYENTSR